MLLLILCIISAIATAALMSWLQPALERSAVRPPVPMSHAGADCAGPSMDGRTRSTCRTGLGTARRG